MPSVTSSSPRVQFTLIGHACLFVEAGGLRILVDPWLSGSCYWRSWWHYPPGGRILPEYLQPDFVYLSHYHFDHFHFPSMRRLDRKAHVLVPKFGVDVMKKEVHDLGFPQVRELPHGDVVTLGGGVRVASFQYGLDDSAFVLAAGDVVLADLNDCKIKGRAAEALVRAFGRPTVLLKSHSWAQAYPNCYVASDPRDAVLLARGDYAETFFASVRELRPRYAVPFASMVGFLHPETVRYNAFAITPPDIAAAARDADLGDAEVVVMAPGDTWSSTDGFSLATPDAFADRDAVLARMARAVDPQLRAAAETEGSRTLTFDAFERHLGGLLAALPAGSTGLLARPVVFHVPSSAEPYWVVDGRRRAVRRAATPPSDRATLIRVPEGVLADAIEKRILSFVHISLRISIEIAPGGLHTDFAFWALLMFYEIGYLPLRRALTPRVLGVAWRRRTEARQLFASLIGPSTLAEKLVSALMTTERNT